MSQPSSISRASLIFPAVGLLVVLGMAAWVTRDALNPDAIAYLRLGEYVARGQFDLAVSGYWGPLLSWMMAPSFLLGTPPLLAARLVMMCSGVVFWVGCVQLFRSMRLPSRWIGLGAWIAAGTAAVWSTEQITPDLLFAGLLALGWSGLIDWSQPLTKGRALRAGVWFGLATLAKPIALPVALVLVPAALLIRGRSGGSTQNLVRMALWGTLALALVVGSWSLALSVKYERPTFSTGGPINHAIAGPDDVDRTHPFLRTLHVPEAGRITSWEDPTRMTYPLWSPLDSSQLMKHQVGLAGRNLLDVIKLLTILAPVWIFVFAGLLFLARFRKDSDTRSPWTTLIVGFLPVVALTLAYLPFRVGGEDRYLYPAWPFAFAATLAFAELWLARWPKWGGFLTPRVVQMLVLGVFVLALARPAVRALSGRVSTPGSASVLAAEVLRADDATGRVAGTGRTGGQVAGLYTAFLADLPWVGWNTSATAEALQAVGATYLIAGDGDSVAVFAERAGWKEIGMDTLNGTGLRVFRP